MGGNELFITLPYTEFQSTHPVWDGTGDRTRRCSPSNISIHPSRVGWDLKVARIATGSGSISIHPSRVGWDERKNIWQTISNLFQSTHPVWDGTCKKALSFRINSISIHPSRVGWDHNAVGLAEVVGEFQSTHPVWDGTMADYNFVSNNPISIHPSRVGWDDGLPIGCVLHFPISIHPSRVGWDATSATSGALLTKFQSTHPVWDGTSELWC